MGLIQDLQGRKLTGCGGCDAIRSTLYKGMDLWLPKSAASTHDSANASVLGAFVESPLKARGGGCSVAVSAVTPPAVAVGSRFVNGFSLADGETETVYGTGFNASPSTVELNSLQDKSGTNVSQTVVTTTNTMRGSIDVVPTTPSNGTYAVTMGADTISVQGDTDRVTTAVSLRSELNASAISAFAAVTWSGESDEIIGTADEVGVRFSASLTASGSTAAVTNLQNSVAFTVVQGALSLGTVYLFVDCQEVGTPVTLDEFNGVCGKLAYATLGYLGGEFTGVVELDLWVHGNAVTCMGTGAVAQIRINGEDYGSGSPSFSSSTSINTHADCAGGTIYTPDGFTASNWTASNIDNAFLPGSFQLINPFSTDTTKDIFHGSGCFSTVVLEGPAIWAFSQGFRG